MVDVFLTVWVWGLRHLQLQLQLLHALGWFLRRGRVSDGFPLKGMGKMNSSGGVVRRVLVLVMEKVGDVVPDKAVGVEVEIMLVSEDAPEREKSEGMDFGDML